jgi:hypothetical protein
LNRAVAGVLVDILVRVPLFSDLDERELRLLADSMHERIFPAGVIIIAEGTTADRFFVINDGEADVTVVGDLPRWRSVLSGEVKLPSALMTGELRAAGKGLTGPNSIADASHAIAFLVGLGSVPGAVSELAVAAAKAQREAGLIK